MKLSKIVKSIQKGYESEIANKCNIAIILKVNVAEILKHPSTEGLFEQYKKLKTSKITKKSDWEDLLIENYKKKYHKSNKGDHVVEDVRYVWEQVDFNIKNNILWKNKEIDFNDIIFHELEIPYEYKKDDEDFFILE